MDFRVEYAAVQGHDAARQVMEAVSLLDRDAHVDVIVIARGGGALEDLLPFSDEGLVRAVFACRTPVVSAIGHEEDQPLLDLVADVRASTPTDAAKRVVPDVREELDRVHAVRDRGRYVVDQLLRREQHGLDQVGGHDPRSLGPGRRSSRQLVSSLSCARGAVGRWLIGWTGPRTISSIGWPESVRCHPLRPSNVGMPSC